MNKYTLSFKNAKFEDLYRKQAHQKELQIFAKNCTILLVIGICVAVNQIIYIEYTKSVIILILLLILGFLFYQAKKSYNLLDMMVQVQSLLLNTAHIYFLLIDVTITLESEKMYYHFFGIFFAHQQLTYYNYKLIILSLFVGTRFYLKMINFLCVTLIEFVFLYGFDRNYYSMSKLTFMISALSFFVYIYMTEKQKKLVFQLQNQKEQWNNCLETTHDLAIIKCHFNQRSRQLQANFFNEIAEKTFSLKNSQDFKNFIRKTEVKKQKKYKNMSLEEEIMDFFLNNSRKQVSSKLTLERFLFMLFVDPKKCQNLFKLSLDNSIYNQKFQLSGVFEKKSFRISCFALYEEQPQYVLLIQSQQDNIENLKNQLKLQNFNKALIKIFKESLNITKILGYIKLYLKSNKQLTNLDYNFISSRLYQYYNMLLNVKIYTEMGFPNMKISRFRLETMLFEIRDIVKLLLDSRKQILKIEISEDIVFESCYWMVYQIVLNSLLNSIECSPRKSTILLFAQKQMDKSGRLSYTTLTIEDGGMRLNQRVVDRLPVINAKEVQELARCRGRLKLGLAVVSHLLRKVGVEKRLRQGEGHGMRKYVSFGLVNDLRVVPRSMAEGRDGVEAEVDRQG